MRIYHRHYYWLDLYFDKSGLNIQGVGHLLHATQTFYIMPQWCVVVTYFVSHTALCVNLIHTFISVFKFC